MLNLSYINVGLSPIISDYDRIASDERRMNDLIWRVIPPAQLKELAAADCIPAGSAQ